MYKRRISSEARVGGIGIGGQNPIRIQSMGTVDTNNTEGCVAQAKRIIDAGGELVRFTTQGVREAENMKNISAQLKADGYQTPLVADVHFTAHTADVAALYCEKVRINPGNYVDPGRTFKHLEYTDEEYAEELKKIERQLVPFLNICKEHHTAVRIGVNHGSLSDRIMSRYGDTPEGIVESCMEFLRIFKREHFNDVVISIKASNTVVMVTTVEGIGDTVRVSLSEEPEYEIPVARKLVDSIAECAALREQAEAGIKDDTVTLEMHETDWESLQLKAAMAVGALFIDKKAHQLVIRNEGFPEARLVELADGILQAARIKFTKTEYISCPGCGRTLYNLQETIAKIKAATKDLVGLKIGIMGCIVNGPGEMADADYGYVGAGRGKISLYKAKECVEKNIPESEAVEKLLELIRKDRA